MVRGLSEGLIVLDRYRLDTVLGHGGMSVVWGATNLVTQRPIALKFLRRAAPLGSRSRRRLAREARASVEHPYIVRVIDILEVDDVTPVLIMELLQGRTLRIELREQGKLSLRRTADLLCPVMAAMGHAHACGVVHRDLKPENIVVLAGSAGSPESKVIDFGVAKLLRDDPDDGETNLTKAGTPIGTVGYAAPEQGFGSRDVDWSADVWSLGVVTVECLTGARPVPGCTWESYLEASLRRCALASEGLDPATPLEVRHLIDRMLASQRTERPDMREAFELLRRYSSTPDAAFALPAVASVSWRTSGRASEWTSEHDLAGSASSTAGTFTTTMTDETVTRNAHAAPGTESRPAAARSRVRWWGLLAGGALALAPLAEIARSGRAAPGAFTPARSFASVVPKIQSPQRRSPEEPQAAAHQPAPGPPGPPTSPTATIRRAAPPRAPSRRPRSPATGPSAPVAAGTIAVATTSDAPPPAAVTEAPSASVLPAPGEPTASAAPDESPSSAEGTRGAQKSGKEAPPKPYDLLVKKVPF
ncbi:protein kinase domain-containing protein [Sorangium sp. So ce861]|uniref:serine/threonine-protein kinase n=1 Tax=Sorangium sp. So ce861 TaxID=3133323 RepID=UPI003F62FDA5